ncbi:MAG: NigD-like protein [Odoribacteraceae bacterium]|jgi:hypothetical protein|nr:NigD-like protein [Odoribacteraceae bacterium]
MKFLTKQLTTCVSLVFAMAVACTDEPDYDTFFLASGTVENSLAGTLTIVLDDNDTTLRVTESAVPIEFFKEDMRLFVNYSILERATPGEAFHYVARVNQAREIPTKGVSWEPASDTTANDPVAIENYWLARDFLTFKYRVRGTTAVAHGLDLFFRQSNDAEQGAEPLVFLDLRHDALGDTGTESLTNYISFSLRDVFPDSSDPVKLRVSYNDSEKASGETSIEITYHPRKRP